MCLFPHTMLPYIRSMEVFFDLSLPKSWADLSDPQLLFFFRQLATDKSMAEIQALCLCQWANVLVRCRLSCSKKSFVNGRCVKLSETYVKHFHIYL